MGHNEPTAAPRFIQPSTPVDNRIQELLTHHPEQTPQAQRLIQLLHEKWPTPLPQPLVSFDHEEAAFALVWQSNTECNTFYIDAGNQTATYCPYPDDQPPDAPLPKLNLNSDEAWQFLRNALTLAQP